MKYVQFEYLIFNLVINSSSVSLADVYRSPPSQENLLNTNTYLVEWTEFLSDFTTTTSEVVIIGDLNIYLDNTTHHHTIAVERTVESFDLQQHVHEPTHYCGHPLDVRMRRDKSIIVSNSEVKDIGLCDDNGTLINSHFAMTCELHHRSIPVKSKSTAYLKKHICRFEIDLR